MPASPWNPFPGLRPFEPEEAHLFFGRERDTDALLRQLRSNRFLAVVGTSGCGKSSLVRCGLIPSLQSGMMSHTGSSWRIAIFRPGGDPIGQLAAALDARDVLGMTADDFAGTGRVMVEASLRRGTLGLVESIRQAQVPHGENVLILVDQFEELFRFRRSRPGATDDAVAFVKLLLEAVNQKDLPIYVVITMRSDFIGECMEFPGLPEALNGSQYLVPRLTRDELRSAITGPVAVAGAAIAPRLVVRLLNDLGDNQDELPVLQHALMRTWDRWAGRGRPDDPIDLPDYEAIGTLVEALSTHADEAYAEAGPHGPPDVTARVFKALTDTYSDPRGIRRPTSIGDLAAICGAPVDAILRIVEIFRRPGRSFLMPPAPTPLGPATIVDLSHESLMRRWRRLVTWAREERSAAELYVRLANEAAYHERGEAGLWDDVEVELASRWQAHYQPTAAWARRYDPSFERAMSFLDASRQERERQRAERRALRIRRLLYAWGTAAVLAIALAVVAYEAYAAQVQRARAQSNFQLAKMAVDQALRVTVPDPAALGEDAPQVQAFRRTLIEKAKPFYDQFIRDQPKNGELREQTAEAHYQLGLINLGLDQKTGAIDEFQTAIDQYATLIAQNKTNADDRQAQANAYNWLGETLRQLSRPAEAAHAYGEALQRQKDLVQENAARPDYQQDLARTFYNQGILAAADADPGQPSFAKAEASFVEAIKRLDALKASTPTPAVMQDLGRVYNNLASLLERDDRRQQEAQRLYEQAIAMHEGLIALQPQNREYRLELARFENNLAYHLLAAGQADQAEARNTRALNLLEDLMQPVPSLGIEHADGHTLHGAILEGTDTRSAIKQYREAVDLLENLASGTDAASLPTFHERYGNLLEDLGQFAAEHPAGEVPKLLAAAVTNYVDIGTRAVQSGHPEDAQRVASTLSEALSTMSERDRASAAKALDELRARLPKREPLPTPLT
jgi:tetratricopeptide (TPR) repeat protein/energy-coupling factor transporter ATP-binding protein EcfA2